MTEMQSSQQAMTFLEHVNELRKRVLYSFAAFLAGFAVACLYAKKIFSFLRLPFDQTYEKVHGVVPSLINTGPLEGFLVYLKVSLLTGFFIGSPFVFFQVWQFIFPALKENERKHVIPFVVLATLFFCGGAFFGYFVVFPFSFEYFLGLIQYENIQATFPLINLLRSC